MKKIKETGVYKVLFKSDGLISVCATAAFAVYNACLGITKHYVFALSIAVYYFLLFLAGILLYFRIKKESVGKENERKAEKTNGETIAAQDADNGRSEKKRYVFISSLLFIINLLLIGPVALMAMNRRNYTLGMIPAIAVAAYSVYKIARAVFNYGKTRKGESDARRIRHAIRLIDALVSVKKHRFPITHSFAFSSSVSVTFSDLILFISVSNPANAFLMFIGSVPM